MISARCLAKWFGCCVLLLVLGTESAWAALADPDRDLAALDRLEIFQPGEPSLLFGSKDEPFASLAPEYRIFVPLHKIPLHVRQAVLAVEDAQFYQHGAVSLKGMARAALRNLTSAKVREGGSTITQQLAKNLFLSAERTLVRKVREIQLAREIEARYSKDKILEMYLNTIYLGGGAYGIEAAARTYFSKSVERLSLVEGALLAGLIRAPSTTSPFADIKRARARRDTVLRRMETEKLISSAQAKAAIAAPVTLNPLFRVRGVAPYFVDYLRKELEPRFGRTQLARGGLRIHTTLDVEMQRMAVEVLRDRVRGIEKTLAARRKGAQPPAAGLEAALVIVEPASGEIRAMVGGLDYTKSQFNRVTQARRQPGSTFKPFVYLAALERGFAPNSRLDDYPVSYSIPQDGGFIEWSPENYDRQFRGPVTLRHALEESINVPTVRLLEAVGVDPVIQIARRFGIRSDLRREYGLALGVSEVNLLELTGAYGVLANRGLRVPVTGIRRVLGSGEEPIDSSPASAERVVREEIAFIAQSLLEGVVERGTAKRGRVSGWSVAAKTGTSQEAMDLWFVGFTSRLAAGLWVGYDQPRSLGSHETAGRVAAPVWSDIMRRALRGLMPEETQMPEGVLSVRVNYQTGQPTGEDDPLGITEYFVRGDMGTPAPETLPRAPEPSTSPPVQPIQTHPESSGQR